MPLGARTSIACRASRSVTFVAAAAAARRRRLAVFVPRVAAATSDASSCSPGRARTRQPSPPSPIRAQPRHGGSCANVGRRSWRRRGGAYRWTASRPAAARTSPLESGASSANDTIGSILSSSKKSSAAARPPLRGVPLVCTPNTERPPCSAHSLSVALAQLAGHLSLILWSPLVPGTSPLPLKHRPCCAHVQHSKCWSSPRGCERCALNRCQQESTQHDRMWTGLSVHSPAAAQAEQCCEQSDIDAAAAPSGDIPAATLSPPPSWPAT